MKKERREVVDQKGPLGFSRRHVEFSSGKCVLAPISALVLTKDVRFDSIMFIDKASRHPKFKFLPDLDVSLTHSEYRPVRARKTTSSTF